MTSACEIEGRAPRRAGRPGLSAEHRLLCLIGPVCAVAIWAAALFMLPAVPRVTVLKALLGRPCLLRTTTGVPCAFCGGTRAVRSAVTGEWLQSAAMNPAGFLLMAAGPLVGAWLGLCAATGRDLGLFAVGRFLARMLSAYVVVGLVLGLWGYKIFMSCVMGIG